MTDNLSDQRVVSYESELKHLDEHLLAEMHGYQESDAEHQRLLDDAARSLELAKQRFYLLSGEGEATVEDELFEDLLCEAETSFRKLDERQQNGGPPLA